jgi:hypothetical protein
MATGSFRNSDVGRDHYRAICSASSSSRMRRCPGTRLPQAMPRGQVLAVPTTKFFRPAVFALVLPQPSRHINHGEGAKLTRAGASWLELSSLRSKAPSSRRCGKPASTALPLTNPSSGRRATRLYRCPRGAVPHGDRRQSVLARMLTGQRLGWPLPWGRATKSFPTRFSQLLRRRWNCRHDRLRWLNAKLARPDGACRHREFERTTP